MKHKAIYLGAGCLVVLQLMMYCPAKSQSKVTVGFLGVEKSSGLSGERLAAYHTAGIQPGVNLTYFIFNDILHKKAALDKNAILWYHRPDSAALSFEESSSRVIQQLKKYVEHGGCLILTLDALRLLRPLGLESVEPSHRYVSASDNGYGRKLGIHCFREHPLFDGLYGGAYLFAPDNDTRVRQTGWFGDDKPAGETVAVDWAYINLVEDNKLVAEYDLGRGKVLAVGAYTVFDNSNLNQPQLALFMRNCFRYLTGQSSSKTRYWEFMPNSVVRSSVINNDIVIGQPQPWPAGTESLTLRRPASTDNPWDVAGERILLMGKEKSGIDEVWAHPFMALRDYEAGIRFEGTDSTVWLGKLVPSVEVRPESFNRTYSLAGGTLKEIIVCHPTDPAAIVHYELQGLPQAMLLIRFHSNLRLMWPYSERVTGEILYDWAPAWNAVVIRDRSGDLVTIAGANKKPLQHLEGQYNEFLPVVVPDNLDRMVRADSVYTGVVTEKFQAGVMMVFRMNPADQLDVVLASSATGPEDAENTYRQVSRDPSGVFKESLHYYQNMFENKLNFTTPDSSFNEGYRWAVVGTDRFFVNTPGIGRSMVAGYATTDFGWDGGHKVNGRPGYAWYFGRDGVWSGYATLGFGDFDKVRTILELYIRYQDLSGKIFHELTTSGVAHYDAADATPLFISLAGRYLKHSGDVEFIRKNWDAIQKAIRFCYSTDTDGDGLIENTLVGHGWEEGGALYGTHTTFYLASCWAEALHESAYMAHVLGFNREAMDYTRSEGIVLQKLNHDFWNPERNFFFHGKYKDNSYHPEPDVMAAVPLLYGQIRDTAQWKPVLKTLASNWFSTDWGVRILSENSPLFKPGSYHQGSVWPLFTGWTSLAEYKYGSPNQGYFHLMNNLLTYKLWSLGFVPEVLHGSECKPFGVCAHQCWSETMVLEPAIEGMLGLEPFATENQLSLSPQFPADWDSVSVTNIRMGEKYFNLNMKRQGLCETWTFNSPGSDTSMVGIRLNLRLPLGTKIHRVLIDGKEAELRYTGGNIKLVLLHRVKTTIEIYKSGGICAIPEVVYPHSGQESKGCRILSESLEGNTYNLLLEGIAGSEQSIRLYSPDGIAQNSNGCVPERQEGNIFSYRVKFPYADGKYVLLPLQFRVQ